MLWKLFGVELDDWTPPEEGYVARLAAAHRRLPHLAGHIDTKSEAGFGSCAAFLEGLDSVAQAMHLEQAPRTYRDTFTINYRALFPGQARHYRMDVFEASADQFYVIYVNGDKFEFTAEVMRRAEALQKVWAEVGAILSRWHQAAEQPWWSARPTRSEVNTVLVAFDFAWASFEHKYITELIKIEEKARRLVVQAIEHEHRLQQLEEMGKEALHESEDYREEQRLLVRCISRLNTVANIRRKGRGDLGVEVLYDATAALRRSDAKALVAVRVLSADVTGSFEAMRRYFRQVSFCLERLDPHLCNNEGLAARLVDWEESWEVGKRYIQNAKLLKCMSSLVVEIRSAQQIAPALASMCEECDAELFLVLPRMIWLCFLAQPEEYTALVRSLLPHLFVSHPEDAAETPAMKDSAFQALAEKFQSVNRSFPRATRTPEAEPHIAAEAGHCSKDTAGSVLWEVLVKRTVMGPDCAYNALDDCGRDVVRAEVEGLMHALEPWSIKLQRHCPEDWNQCSAVVVQCLSGEGHAEAPFHV